MVTWVYIGTLRAAVQGTGSTLLVRQVLFPDPIVVLLFMFNTSTLFGAQRLTALHDTCDTYFVRRVMIRETLTETREWAS